MAASNNIKMEELDVDMLDYDAIKGKTLKNKNF
jgi:hypothetical protein